MVPAKRPVTKYAIELAPSKEALVKRVNERLAAGWEIQGPISIKYPKNALLPMYGQALVWRKETAPPVYATGSSGCLGVAVLCAALPSAAILGAQFI